MKKVLITGGTGAIGQALVECYARQGYTVLLHYNSSQDIANQLSRDLRHAGYDIHTYQADLGDINQLDKMMKDIIRLHKRIDVVVNNAGVELNSTISATTIEQYDHCMAVNCRASYFVSKYAIDNMQRNGQGSIVMISSIWGLEGGSCESVYAMTKHALVGLTKSLALEASNININCVCPAIVRGGMSRHLSEQDIEQFNAEHDTITLTCHQVAEAVLAISESDSSGLIIDIGRCQ